METEEKVRRLPVKSLATLKKELAVSRKACERHKENHKKQKRVLKKLKTLYRLLRRRHLDSALIIERKMRATVME